MAAGALLLAAALAAAPPAVAETDIEQVVVAGEYRYARGRRSGVHVSFDQGHTWHARGEGLPRRITYPFPEPPEFAAVTHLAADPSDPRRLAATTATGLYLTTDGGVSWREIPVRDVPFNTYFTSVALSPHDPAGMLLGTSFHGVFETADGGATWWHLRSVLGFLLEQALFYEEVAGLSYDPSAPRAMTVLAGFDGGVYHVADRLATGSGRSSSPVRRYPAPAAGIIQLAYAPVDDGWELQAGTVDARWRLTASGAWSPVDAKAQELHGAPPLPLAPQPVPAQPAEPASADPQPPSDAESPQPAAPVPGSPQPAPATDSPQAAASASESPKPAAPSDTPQATQAAADPQPPAAPSEAPAAPAGASESAPLSQPAADPQPSTGPSEAPQTSATAADVRQPAQAASDPQSPATATGATQPAAAGTSEQPVEPASAPRKSPIVTGLPQVPPPGSGPQRPPPPPATAPALTPPDSGPTEPPAPATTPANPAPDTARSQAPAGGSADAAASDAPAPDTGESPSLDTASPSPASPPSEASTPDAVPSPAPASQSATSDTPVPDAPASPATAGAERPAAAEPALLPAPPPLPAAATRSAPRPQAALRNGIYLSTYRAAEALPEYLEFLNRHGLDSVVIDFKDDHGALSYDSNLPVAHEIGAAPGPVALDRLIEQAHRAGIYVIARLVVFKDRYLYDWQDHRLAIWDSELDAPWRHLVAGDDPDTKVQREYWVDPFAPEVWEYNVAVAAELAARGVDEIQFDYIRFPSDGPVERSRHRHRRPGMSRIDAIESFLALARERLQVPISTDLFGFNSWYRAGNWLGQDIAVLSEYADVISPMFYPSHFPDHFLDDRSYAERAYAIYEAGVRRAQRMVQGRSYVRPYVQAFLIGKELRMEEEEFSDYLTRQLDGNRAAAGSGFTLWNASNRYYMVTEPLQPYFDARGEEMP